jgi:hypothetical protein
VLIYWRSTPAYILYSIRHERATLAASVDISELMLKSHGDWRSNCCLLQFPEICIMLWDKRTYHIFNNVTGLISGFCNTCFCFTVLLFWVHLMCRCSLWCFTLCNCVTLLWYTCTNKVLSTPNSIRIFNFSCINSVITKL